MPNKHFISVDFPAPFSPISACTVPFFTVKETWSRPLRREIPCICPSSVTALPVPYASSLLSVSMLPPTRLSCGGYAHESPVSAKAAAAVAAAAFAMPFILRYILHKEYKSCCLHSGKYCSCLCLPSNRFLPERSL